MSMTDQTKVAIAQQKYALLLERVDEKFNETSAKHRAEMLCGNGCHGCCQPKISVFKIERDNIRRYLMAQPNRIEDIARLEEENPFQDSRCKFLDAEGSCMIYDARPLICRSHGAPVFIPASSDRQEAVYDVCPLNFRESDIKKLPAADFFNIQLLNEILVGINLEYTQTDLSTRFLLDLESILESETHV